MKTFVFTGSRNRPFTTLGALREDGSRTPIYVIPGTAFTVGDDDAEAMLKNAETSGVSELFMEVHPDPTDDEWLPALAEEQPDKAVKRRKS